MEKEKITIETIEKLAEISQLEFSMEEKERLVGEVSGIIDMLDQCGNFQADNLVCETKLSIKDLREDVVKFGLGTEDALKNAPISKQDYLGVPKVVNYETK